LAVHDPVGRGAGGQAAYASYTYADLAARADRMARALALAGIAPGQRVALMVPPSLPFFALTFALFRMRAVPVFIDPGMGLRSLKRCLAEAAPQAFVAVAKAHLARVVLGWQRGRLDRCVLVGKGPAWPGVLRLDALEERAAKAPAPDFAAAAPDDLAAVLFTSGSTGSPKGAVYTHANFNAQVELLKAAYGIEPGEVDLCTFPLFALFAPALGMTAVVPRMDFTRPARVDPQEIIEPVHRFGATNLFGSPALLRRLAHATQASGTKLPTLRRVISAGAPVSARILRDLTPALAPGVEIFTPYGATEALPVASIGSGTILRETAARTDEGRGICVGRPVPGVEVRIVPITDEALGPWRDDLALPAGELGEIVVRGPQVTGAYYARPEATARAKIQDPATGRLFHRMGDLGYLDEAGRLWFCGRKTHRLATPAGDLYTIPCEAVFNAHADVYRTALVGRGPFGSMHPVLCVETARPLPRADRSRLKDELLALGARHAHTTGIRDIRFFKALPVDTRHNAKIFREQLKLVVDEGGGLL
jgi:acyl-CoA synthetase (AMP-forming)/AMP-acid ligase II